MGLKKVYTLLEITLHVILIVAVPIIFLEITTGFDKYLLPDTMPLVYVYWLIYIALTVTIYGLRRRKKKYQPPDCTKKYRSR